MGCNARTNNNKQLFDVINKVYSLLDQGRPNAVCEKISPARSYDEIGYDFSFLFLLWFIE